VNNIYVFEKRGIDYYQIGILSNQGANPQAPYYDDLFIQELDTGADTFQFSTVSSSYVQDLLVIGNYVGFYYNNRYEIFAITGLEYSHYEGYKTIGVYAEGIGFELLEVFMERPPITEYPGRDNDNDGDDQYDDEYADPDDIYIDENGNIIYDKNGSGPPKKEDVTIDGNGNIIYKPNKKNKNNDSLEFKNISYPTFLNVLLKGTDWKIVCQPGLESVKHDISVRYDTNIYAILQDSMQAFRGVELEFVHEAKAQHSAGDFPVQKIIKAYKDGGRGSFVGKRFEYGTNVRGITKTQEVAHNKEDSVIYVDNVGVDVYYDIDFALKSAEVPEIEIGDTHYVIDNEFRPPMTIKARIGRIEISFSDPTKNKITVANNKKIMGSIVDDDDINDTVKNIDDTISDTITDDYIYDIIDDTITGDYLLDYATVDYVDSAIEAAQLGGGGIEDTLDTLTVRKIQGFPPEQEGFYNCVEFEDAIKVTHIWGNDGVVEIWGYGVDELGGGVSMHCNLSVYGDITTEGDILAGGTIKATKIKFADGTTMTTAGSSSGGSGGNLNKYINVVETDSIYNDIGEDFGTELHIRRPVYFDGPIHLTGDMGNEIGAASGYYSSIFGVNQIETMILNCDSWRPNDIYKDVTFYGDVIIDGALSYRSIKPFSDISKKENIRYIDEPVKRTNDDLLNKADLHNFIVNQVNICEYNFIGDDSDKIGFIANDYEGTKVGDKIVSKQEFKERNDEGEVINTSELLVYDSDNLLFATIGALQEEVRMRDEQIASLEARLAAIEEMLNNK
jgi:hypothetical protein